MMYGAFPYINGKSPTDGHPLVEGITVNGTISSLIIESVKRCKAANDRFQPSSIYIIVMDRRHNEYAKITLIDNGIKVIDLKTNEVSIYNNHGKLID